MTDLNDDYDTPVFAGMTRRVLEAQFNRVCDPENWKMPIDREFPAATIYEAEIEEILMAIVFYTGGPGQVSRRGDQVRIVAPGYYATVGA